jgi:hypothetical protein
LAAFKKLADVFPVAMPRFLLFEGRRQWLQGGTKQAGALWERGRALAEALLMPYDLALIHLELGTNVLLPGADRSRHREQAKALFERLGATYEATRLITYTV